MVPSRSEHLAAIDIPCHFSQNVLRSSTSGQNNMVYRSHLDGIVLPPRTLIGTVCNHSNQRNSALVCVCNLMGNFYFGSQIFGEITAKIASGGFRMNKMSEVKNK